MSDGPFDRASALGADLAQTLTALFARGHVVAVPGCPAPSFREARRFVEMSLWMLWRAPHVMLVPCVLPGERPAVLVATWDPRGVALRQTVTSATDFAAEVHRAAGVMRGSYGADDLALAARLRRDEAATPDLENMEFWPEVLAGIQAAADDPGEPDDPGAAVALPLVERAWPARLADHRERLRALED
jgi:hypothetical protein